MVEGFSEDQEDEFVHTGKIIPLYPSTESLGRSGLDSRGFRRVMRNLLRIYGEQIEDILLDATIPYDWKDKPIPIELDPEMVERIKGRWSELGL